MNKQILRNIIFVGLFAVPFVPFLVSSSLFFPFITTKAFTWRIIVEIIFATWLLLAVLDANYRPRRSIILYSIFGFLAVIGLADLFGVAPVKSFWSNFERMEGFISLLHLGMFFLVISSVFNEVNWKAWWNTSLVASFMMVIYSVLQISGAIDINQGGVRVDGTFGNAIYLAVYMLIHIFVALLFMWRSRKTNSLKWVYGLLILTQIFVLYHTATRGAILGLIGGLVVMALLNIRNKEDAFARKISIGTLIGLVVLVGGFISVRNAEFVKNSPVLARFSSLNTEEIKMQGRYFVWPMAIDGFKERPILGWGQDNFNYIFQKNYQPEMFRLEPWFDHAHNIFLDWMVFGGIFGLLAYLFLYFALLVAIWKRSANTPEQNFSHVEKSILTGLISAYFFHNFFVFDHLVSYVLFFSLLAYVHHRTAKKIISSEQNFNPVYVRNIGLPIAGIFLILVVYFVNIKPMMTNAYLIKALMAVQTPGQMSVAAEHFKKAYSISRLGRPEVVEHIAANSGAILTSDKPLAEKESFFGFAKNAVLSQASELEGDARYQLLAGSFLSTTGQLDEALANLEKAKASIPGKQQVYFEIGAVYLNMNKPQEAFNAFKYAYESAPEYLEAKIIYLVGAIYARDTRAETEILSKLKEREVTFDDRVLVAYYNAKRTNAALTILENRKRLDPDHSETYQQYIDSIVK